MPVFFGTGDEKRPLGSPRRKSFLNI